MADQKTNTNSTDRTIKIAMLGGFSLVIGDNLISDATGRTHQLWNLLEYLIAHRFKTIPQEELIEALWPDDSIDNPAGALKNLVYRIRTMLTGSGVESAKEIICYQRGTYHWNNTLSCTVDTEEFERLAHRAEAEQDVKTKISLYQCAIALYKGDFLPSSAYEQWVVPLSGYYRGLYFRCVYAIGALLVAANQYEELARLCERAIQVDPFEELVNRLLISAYIGMDKPTQALEQYHLVTNLFYRELGVKPSEEMRALYRDITKSVNNVEMDIHVIKEDLNEISTSNGAFYCDYEVFRNLYRIEARGAARSGQSVYIALLTLSDKEDKIPKEEIYSKVMDQLLQVAKNSLRRGDIISRFSATQYVLMMLSLTFENGQMVLERIGRNFKQLHRRDDIKIHTVLHPLEPLED